MKPSRKGIKLLKDNGIGEIELRGLEENHIYFDLLKNGQLYSMCCDLTDATREGISKFINNYVNEAFKLIKNK